MKPISMKLENHTSSVMWIFFTVFTWLSIANTVSTEVPDGEPQKPTLTISAKKGIF